MLVLIAEILIAVVVGAAIYLKWNFNYWKRKHFPYIPAKSPLFGSFQNPATWTENIGFQLKNHYVNIRRNNHKHFGVYLLWKPFYVPVEPELIKNILIKDFDQFADRGAYVNEEDDPLTAHMFNVDVHKWRHLRAKLTQTFTSGKMKMMFHTLLECGDRLKETMDKRVDSGNAVKIKDELGKFTMNVIGSCAFGLDCNAFEYTDSDFIRLAKKIFIPEGLDILKNFFAFCFPKFFKKLGMRVVNPEVSEFFMRVIYESVKYREANQIVRNDFLHLLIQLKNGQLMGDDDGKYLHNLTLNEISAQAFMFFLAGFETSSSTATFCLYEMASNQDVQQRLREEIVEMLESHKNQLTYECRHEMKYMDQVVDETLRKYPSIPLLNRKSVNDYTIPGTQEPIEKGTAVMIPVVALHHDPEYYPDPGRFDPDRFSDENKHSLVPYTYLPFGDGPRNCIVLRFGKMQTKVALAILMKNFSFSLNEKTQLPLRMDPQSFVLTVKGDVWLNIERLDA